jgi:hypothetical protein
MLMSRITLPLAGIGDALQIGRVDLRFRAAGEKPLDFRPEWSILKTRQWRLH